MNDTQIYTKADVDYGPSKSPAEHRCGICSHLERVPGVEPCEYLCHIVQGPIEEMAGCKKFDVNLIKAANDKITLASNPPKK